MSRVRRRSKIIYIERDRSLGRLMGELMETSEPSSILRTFRSGRQAIELLRHTLVEPPDMILLGDDCGGMSTFDLLRAIGVIAQMRDVPILMVGAPDRHATRESIAILRALIASGRGGNRRPVVPKAAMLESGLVGPI